MTTTGEQITVSDTCGRCMGYRDAFRRYRTLNGGECFQCKGAGVISVTYTPEQQVQREWNLQESRTKLLTRIADLISHQKATGGCGYALAFALWGLKEIDAAMYERALPRALRHFSQKFQDAVLNRIDELTDEAAATA